jgi:hypothetical protein
LRICYSIMRANIIKSLFEEQDITSKEETTIPPGRDFLSKIKVKKSLSFNKRGNGPFFHLIKEEIETSTA